MYDEQGYDENQMCKQTNKRTNEQTKQVWKNFLFFAQINDQV